MYVPKITVTKDSAQLSSAIVTAAIKFVNETFQVNYKSSCTFNRQQCNNHSIMLLVIKFLRNVFTSFIFDKCVKS